MKNITRSEKVVSLFWFYQKLLTDKQQDYFKLYFLEDWSLAEIAQYFKVTRAAVYDALIKIKNILSRYEIILKLKHKQLLRDQIYRLVPSQCRDWINQLKAVDNE